MVAQLFKLCGTGWKPVPPGLTGWPDPDPRVSRGTNPGLLGRVGSSFPTFLFTAGEEAVSEEAVSEEAVSEADC